ncbi:hypothetical protein BC834DRAFT_970488 [Gloeopeniophorella convolvens]|nr:hypothetical protein BC834DRAFT_970488 [Gloeopeniophorella convolvens]
MDVLSSGENLNTAPYLSDPRPNSPTRPLFTSSSIRVPTARTEARAALLKEAENLKTRLRSVYTQFNTLLPISLLPPELLSRIFRFLRDDDYYSASSRKLHWIRVTRVCRQWHQIALDDVSLWSTIVDPGYNQKCLSEMLSRSKRSTINLEITSQLSSEMFNALSELFPRIRALSLPTPAQDSPQLQGLLRSIAPLLEDFSFKSMCYRTTVQENANLSGEPKLFNGQAPKLRKLCLEYIAIPWTHLPRQNLTHLSVVVGSEPDLPLSLGTMDQLVDLLVENGPSLQVLKLAKCLPPTPSQRARTDPIALPRLYELELDGPTSHVMRLFELLETPSLMLLRLNLTSKSHAEISSWPMLVPDIASRFNRADLTAFRRLRLSIDPGSASKTTVDASMAKSSLPHLLHPSSPDNARLCLEFSDECKSGQKSLEIIRKMCSALSMSVLDSLNIFVSQVNYVTADDWVQFFQPCTKVISLDLSGWGVESLLQALKIQKPIPLTNCIDNRTAAAGSEEEWDGSSSTLSQDETEDEPTAEPLLFPNLALLYLNYLDFTRYHDDFETVFELVGDVLERRQSWDVEIYHLYICDSRIDAEDAATLSGLVHTFEWDKDEGKPSEPSEAEADPYEDDYGDWDDPYNYDYTPFY